MLLIRKHKQMSIQQMNDIDDPLYFASSLTRLPPEEIVECLRLLTAAWPLRVELLDSMGHSEEFEPASGEVGVEKKSRGC